MVSDGTTQNVLKDALGALWTGSVPQKKITAIEAWYTDSSNNVGSKVWDVSGSDWASNGTASRKATVTGTTGASGITFNYAYATPGSSSAPATSNSSGTITGDVFFKGSVSGDSIPANASYKLDVTISLSTASGSDGSVSIDGFLDAWIGYLIGASTSTNVPNINTADAKDTSGNVIASNLGVTATYEDIDSDGAKELVLSVDITPSSDTTLGSLRVKYCTDPNTCDITGTVTFTNGVNLVGGATNTVKVYLKL